MTDKLKVWRGWLKEDLYQQIADLYHRREVWEAVTAFISDQDRKDRFYFLNPFTRMYVDSQASAVRRLVTGDQDSISLTKLMQDIAQNSQLLTKDDFESHWNLPAPESRDPAEKAAYQTFYPKMTTNWLLFAESENAVSIDPNIVLADLNELKDKSKTIKKYVDRTIAHIDRRGLPNLPTFDDLDETVDHLGATYCRYEILLTGSSVKKFLAPVPQGDVLAPFRP